MKEKETNKRDRFAAGVEGVSPSTGGEPAKEQELEQERPKERPSPEETQQQADEDPKEERPSGISRAAASEEEMFTDVKQFPEDPFSYRISKQEQVQLGSGTFQYEVTDFVLPGRDGFDLTMTRRYDSGCANREDMNPYQLSVTLYTGQRDNNHYNQVYGLGYGWSFVLPSIEAVPYMGEKGKESKTPIYFRFTLHLEDGRTLSIQDGFEQFRGYQIGDVTICRQRGGSLSHPTDPGKTVSYEVQVEYKDGRKDYFHVTDKEYPNDDFNDTKSIYTLVAREDRFGNRIFFSFETYGGITIIDSWKRTITLRRTESGLVWSFPTGMDGKNCEIKYQISRAKKQEYNENNKVKWTMMPERLVSVTDPFGRKTSYQYENESNTEAKWKGKMAYAAEINTELKIVGNECAYMPLRTIVHATGAQTQFTYTGVRMQIGSGGYVEKFLLSSRKEVVDGTEYHREDYQYWLSEFKRYIEQAIVTRHGEVIETNTFDKEGLLTKREVQQGGTLVSEQTYTYGTIVTADKGRIIAAVERTLQAGNHSKWLEKKTGYSWDGNGNIVTVQESYAGDPASDQEINTRYGKYNQIIEKTWKQGTKTIKESYELHSGKGQRVVQYKQVYEGGVLKEKTSYDYTDGNNPYCVTKEKRYLAANGQSLEQATTACETVYGYDKAQYTHAVVSKQIINMRDATGQAIAALTETFAYDPWGRMIRNTNAKGQTTTITYDILGRVVSETLPSVNGQTYRTQTDYQDAKNYLTQTDAKGQKQRIEYTPLGQVARVYLAVGNAPQAGDVLLQSYQYNRWGELTEVLTYNGMGQATNHIKKSEQYAYDAFGRLLSRKIPQVGYQESHQYTEVMVDPADGSCYQQQQTTIHGDTNAPTVVTVAWRDAKGQTRKEFLAGERVATYVYDQVGNRLQQRDAENHVERWEYDYAGRVLRSIRMENGQERVRRTEYDTLGRQRYQWDEAGKRREFQYDSASRLIQTNAPFDSRLQITQQFYDGVGNVIRQRKARAEGWQEVSHGYDARNRLTETVQYRAGTGDWMRTRYQYDVLGQVTEMRTGDTPSGEGNRITRYTYDRFGNVLTTTDALGQVERYHYDKVGMLQTKTDRQGNQTVYQYDALGRPVKEVVTNQTADGRVQSEREYGYSKTGQTIRLVSRQTEADRGTVVLETHAYFNNKGQLIRQNDPGTVTKEYTYDRQGRRQSFRQSRSGQATPDQQLYYSYDDLSRLQQVRKDSASGVVLAEYRYDVRGNRTMLRYPQSSLETSYQYNDANYVVALTNKQAGQVVSAWAYLYDVDGNLTSKTDQASTPPTTATYRYDGLGRLIDEDEPNWKRARYEYDAYGNRIRMTVEGRTHGETFAVTTYQYDRNNRLEQEVKKEGKTTETYQYQYDNNGNETFRIWEQIALAPADPGEVYLSGKKRSHPTVYEWRQYNGFHQLIRIFQDEGEIAYQYRGDGMRHSKEVKLLTEPQAKKTLFYWDGTDIVGEQTDGKGVSSYLRGLNLIANQREGMLYYYLFNQHGDVVQVRDQSGSRVRSYPYDAFGQEKDLWEEDENPFRYCGEYLDIETNTYYLRNRYYDPANSRMLSEDPVRDGLNYYLYCYNNPIFYVDPSGNIPSPAQIWDGFKNIARTVVKTGERLFNSGLINVTDWISNNTPFDISLDSAKAGSFFLMMDLDDNGVYHASIDCWQQYFGYNGLYDLVFDMGTSATPSYYQFAYSGENYRFWAWKGDYLNLGAGAELGIYRQMSINGMDTPHWLVDRNLSLPMSMTLKDNKGNLIAQYNPSEPQWWITSFNPAFQNMKAENLRVSFTVDLSGNKGMFNAFYNEWSGKKDTPWTFDKKNYTATLNI